MRPKARVLAQHGGPPSWLEASDAECAFVRYGRSMPPANILLSVHKTRKAWPGILVDPCLLSGYDVYFIPMYLHSDRTILCLEIVKYTFNLIRLFD